MKERSRHEWEGLDGQMSPLSRREQGRLQLLRPLHRYAGNRPRMDDMTLLVIRRER